MGDRWYHAHDDNSIGPFSDQQLRDLADAGQILPTDTIWKEGIKGGVVASKVKKLFSLAHEDTAPAVAKLPDTKVDTSSPSPASTRSSEKLTATSTGRADPKSQPYLPTAQQKQDRKKRAVAGNGVIIVGQDGTNVRIRKKCVMCGLEDSCFHTMRITIGMNKSTFFCRKCRKTQQVEFQGFAS